ncbi:hypothetical protein Trydic_g17899 [Trypoxylus dichotomus]
MENLGQWSKGRRKKLAFGVAMVWRQLKNHAYDPCFCLIETSGYNKHKNKIVCPSIESAIQPVPHAEEIPVSVYEELPSPEYFDAEYMSESIDEQDSDVDSNNEYMISNDRPQHSTQAILNDLVRDLGLSKKSSEVLTSGLNKKNLLKQSTKITFYRRRESGLVQYFKQEYEFVYCNNVPGLLTKSGIVQYDPNEWRLFIDSFNRSLTSVLLYYGNAISSIPSG